MAMVLLFRNIKSKNYKKKEKNKITTTLPLKNKKKPLFFTIEILLRTRNLLVVFSCKDVGKQSVEEEQDSEVNCFYEELYQVKNPLISEKTELILAVPP